MSLLCYVFFFRLISFPSCWVRRTFLPFINNNELWILVWVQHFWNKHQTIFEDFSNYYSVYNNLRIYAVSICRRWRDINAIYRLNWRSMINHHFESRWNWTEMICSIHFRCGKKRRKNLAKKSLLITKHNTNELLSHMETSFVLALITHNLNLEKNKITNENITSFNEYLLIQQFSILNYLYLNRISPVSGGKSPENCEKKKS